MWFMFLADRDLALAAEPGLHDHSPHGDWTGMIAVHGFFDYRFEPGEQQSKNGLSLALGVVIEEGAGDAIVEAAPGQAIQRSDCNPASPKTRYWRIQRLNERHTCQIRIRTGSRGVGRRRCDLRS